MRELIWYEYEARRVGIMNEWHSTFLTADSREDLEISLLRTPYNNRLEFDLRMVRKTLTTVVLIGEGSES